MEKFIPQSPDKFLKKDADMSLAKFGHINAVVDQVTANEAAIAQIQSETIYTEVQISSAQILAMGGSPIELLPSLSANSYYDYIMIFEFTGSSVAYDFTAQLCNIVIFPSNTRVSSSNNWGSTTGSYEITQVSTDALLSSAPAEINSAFSAVQLTTSSGDDATQGNGTALVKIWYKVRTFGSEL